MSDFRGRVAFVTGGGTGIGRATAELIAERGGKVVIAGRRREPLREVAEKWPDAISYVQLDVGDLDAHQPALLEVIGRHGRLDILINCAATAVWKPFEEHSAEEFSRVMHVNLVAPAMLTQRALPFLRETKGNVVNVSSESARYAGMPPQNLSAYSPSKAALNQLTRILATELGCYGIRVNAVPAGMTDTEMAAGVVANPDLVAMIENATPLGRFGRPADVAKVICFCASDEAEWMTGQVVDASGGYHLAQ